MILGMDLGRLNFTTHAASRNTNNTELTVKESDRLTVCFATLDNYFTIFSVLLISDVRARQSSLAFLDLIFFNF